MALGGLLNHLLVASLHRALPLKQVQVGSVRVRQDLDFDVARRSHEFFDKHITVTKRLKRFGRGVFKCFAHFGCGMNNAHSIAPAAGRGLDHQRVANAVGDLLGRFGRR